MPPESRFACAGSQLSPVAGPDDPDTLAVAVTKQNHILLHRAPARWVSALAIGLLAAGCGDTRLENVDPNDGVVRTVTAYDVTLGPGAAPEDVVYVLLRAIHDHVVAAKSGDREGVKTAMQIERSVAAPDHIHRLMKTVIDQNALPKDLTPAQAVHYQTKWWAPIAAHYVADLDLTREEARSRMGVIDRESFRVVQIDVENPDDHRTATLNISLEQENGYWRVYNMSYSPFSIAGRNARPPVATTQPARSTS